MRLIDLRIKVLASHGINVTSHTSMEWLQLALDTERDKLNCGPFDPAFEWLSNRQRYFEDAAVIAEILEFRNRG